MIERIEYDSRINYLVVESNEFRLKQIILNFVSNSVKNIKHGFIEIKALYDIHNEEIVI